VDAWHWVGAAIEAVLLTILVLLWYDTLREDPKWTSAQAAKRAAIAAIVIPVGFLALLILPLWVGGVLIAIPLIAIIVMAMAS
jgi:hypothetical protein